LESLTGIQSVPALQGNGWSLKKHHTPNLIELTRLNGWTILGAAEEHNNLLDELRARIQHGEPQLISGNSRDWLEADLDPAQLIPNLTTLNPQLSTINHLHLSVTGAGTNLLMQGQADFAEPLQLDLKAWNIPTNLIDERLAAFTLVRGLQPWLESLPAWTNLQTGPPPDQACSWALKDLPVQTYFTAPLAEASNAVSALTTLILQKQKVWVAKNDQARFERSQAFDGLEWKGVPLAFPFLRSIILGGQGFIYGGGFPNTVVEPLPAQQLPAVLTKTNLVYHSWEITALRVEQYYFTSQFVRLVSSKAELPTRSPGVIWLRTVAPRLGVSSTDITQKGPAQLSFCRQSSIGFTALELNLLADWLESPQFPCGLYSLLTPPSPQP
jgi:hypothetical protein